MTPPARTWTCEKSNRRLVIDAATGDLVGRSGIYEKRLSELAGVYHDEDEFERAVTLGGDRVVYRVEEYRPSEDPGDLIVGTSTLEPGRIGDEFFVTRGHLHAVVDRPEIYHCVSGHGVMLTEDASGNVEAIEMTVGTIAYVAPGWIHRSVNVGSDRFATVFSYPADSGQDYGVIAEAGGMAELVVVGPSDTWRTVPNPKYVGR